MGPISLRYLTVFGSKGWQVIDVKNNCKVVATGTLTEMRDEAASLNEDKLSYG